MNLDQTAALLAKIQLGDNREVTSLVVREWHDTVGYLDYDDAVAAVRAHRQEATEYLQPAHLVSRVRRIAQGRYVEAAKTERVEAEKTRSDPKPANYEAMCAAWDDPVEWARQQAIYDEQLEALGIVPADRGFLEHRLREIDRLGSRARSWRGTFS